MRRILVVDDEDINRALLKAALRKTGHQLVMAEDGVEALEALRNERFDLVLLDVRMPRMDGIEACRRIRQDLQMLDLPIIIVTAVGDKAIRVAGKEAGCDDFLTKPFDRDELMARVTTLLRLKAHHDERDEALRQARQALLDVERRATLGTLAAGVGHELNNMVGVLLFGMEALRMDVQHEILDDMSVAIQHIAQHGRQLLDLGRPGPDVGEPIDLRQVVERTLGMLRTSGRTKYHKVALELADQPVVVVISRVRVEQIVVNLMGNAVDATPVGRRIQVRVAAQAGRADLQVRDWGSGMSEEVRAQVLQPWFTTKPPDRGTGLGLPVVAQIIQDAGGTMTLESTVGQGTCVRVDLPLA